MIIALFGQPHCGKSTLAEKLEGHNIDGDKLREIFQNKNFTREGRIQNLNRASDIAHYLNNNNTNVVLSLVYPYKEAREYLNNLTDSVVWVYLTYNGERGREKFHVQDFETPDRERILHLDTSVLSIDECINKIINYANTSR